MFFKKLANLCQILATPGALRLKLTEPAFDRELIPLCLSLQRSGIAPRTVLDVGANAGQFALAAVTAFADAAVHSFEPLAAPYQRLAALAGRHPRIRPHHMALGAEAGSADMRVASNTASSSLLPMGARHKALYPEVLETGTERVEVRTIEEIWPELAPEPPVLLKLDVQGFESAVLRGAGARLAEVRWILLETSTRPLYDGEVVFQELCEQLAPHRFQFVGPVAIHVSPAAGARGQFDALFERPAAEKTA